MNIKTILILTIAITLSFQQHTLEQLLAMTDQDLYIAALNNQAGKCYILEAQNTLIKKYNCDLYAKISGQPIAF
jgi:hypothetical protein